MKQKVGRWTVAAGTAAALLVACGGSGEQPSIKISGVAATGAALANAPVAIKCANGTANALTDATGAYSANVPGGAFPCMLQVIGTADGAPVTLHSLAQAPVGVPSAIANITPLTELITAALGTIPSQLFASFSNTGPLAGFGQVLATQFTSTLTGMLNQLTAIGLNINGLDPFTSALIPATANSAGNLHDQILEALKAQVPLPALPILVTQIANAANQGTSAQQKIEEVMAGVKAGGSATCPTVISGRYRAIDYRGAITTIKFDFGKNLATMEEMSSSEASLVPDPTNACEFTINGLVKVAFGPNGVGTLSNPESIAYLVPLQTHAFSAFTGEWNYVESGVREDNNGVHFLGKYTFDANGAGVECGYMDENTDALSATCTIDDTDIPSISASTDGGVKLAYGNTPGVMYGYQAPSGGFFIFGSTNPTGMNQMNTMRSHFILYKSQPWATPAPGAVVKYWDFKVDQDGTTLYGSSQPNQYTVDSVSGNTIQRTVSSTGAETLTLNDPIPGVRTRAPQDGLQNRMHQVNLGGLGLTVTLNGEGADHFYTASFDRP